MAGLYIHIPFCRQACRYCDFYFTVSLKYKEEFIEALIEELVQRKTYIKKEIDTVYFGGGTPSVLSGEDLSKIMDNIHMNYSVSEYAEITIEVNPDDLTAAYLDTLMQNGFRRLSVGVQSFDDKHLKLMNRSHNAFQAMKSLEKAQEKGFTNINLDLIYGLPGLSVQEWEKNLNTAINQPVQHISAYHLTYEPGTIFYHWRKKGKLTELGEQHSVRQFEVLREITAANNFEHYEISNFSKPGFRSKHNSSYWNGKKYIGLGPSAHSYNGEERQWNVSSLKQYIKEVINGGHYFQAEKLSKTDQYHDYLLTSFRTVEGADIDHIKKFFGDAFAEQLKEKSQKFILSGDMVQKNRQLAMSPQGWLRSDLIVVQLFVGDEWSAH